MDRLGGFRKEFDGSQDYDIIFRAVEQANRIVHIPKILYHWRVHKTSTASVADSKPYAYEAGIKVIEEHLKRTEKKGKVEYGQDVPGIYKIKYDVVGNPKVSILIPNKDNINLLKVCINSILKLTTYKNYEICIIENNSEKDETFNYYEQISKLDNIKILRYSGKNEFNYSALINFGVKNVDGDFILQLNNDTKLLTPDWLEVMIGYLTQNKEVGAIGARLYYEDKTIQHAGIIVGLAGFAGNMLVNLPYGKHAYFGREAATRNVSAVTGACLFSRREVYEQVNYMDEINFKVALNDVDFCLKIIEKGYRIVYNPYIELIHFESKSRGYEYSKKQEERFKKEISNFKEKWKNYIQKGDPYYNKNFSRESCDFDILMSN